MCFCFVVFALVVQDTAWWAEALTALKGDQYLGTAFVSKARSGISFITQQSCWGWFASHSCFWVQSLVRFGRGGPLREHGRALRAAQHCPETHQRCRSPAGAESGAG